MMRDFKSAPCRTSFVTTQPHSNAVGRTRKLAPPALLVMVLTLVLLLSSFALHQSGSVQPGYALQARRLARVGGSAAPPTILTVDSTHLGRSFAPGAIGLSLEAGELASGDISADHKSLVALMRLMGPGVLRLGGNTLDFSWWTSDGEPPPAWATTVITPADLVKLRGLLQATGWRAILGADLGHLDPTRAANEARVAKRILGARLLGLEVGNEPNDYARPSIKLRTSAYSVGDYLRELASYKVAIEAAAPGTPLYGPDVSSLTWLQTIVANKTTSFAGLTQHYYPTNFSITKGACKGTPVPSALQLLSSQVREYETLTLRTIVTSGESLHRKALISETNSTGSCDFNGGPATSPVFASALWSFDWILRAASAGVAGINFHGHFGRCLPDTFSPVCAPGSVAAARGQVVARPEYYGLLAARQLENGRFATVDVGKGAVAGDFSAYATVHSGGLLTVALDNFAIHGSTVYLLKVPGYGRATSGSLLGPSISATKGVTFGHASFSAAGMIRPVGTVVPRVDGAFRLKLAPMSAIVVTLHRARSRGKTSR
jgi:hypothetical protein